MRALARSEPARPTFRNPVIAGAPGEDHGDPFVIKYLDEFFLYHSGETAGRRGISVYRSRDLVAWEFAGFALEPAESGWAWSDLWAPEVVYERGVFYMYVSATRRRADDGEPTIWQQGEGDDARRRLGVARATSPLGPFVLDGRPLLDAWAIDGHPFRDDDGTMWLFYNARTVDLGLDDVLPGTGTVCDRLLAPDRLAGEPVAVTLPSERWEGVPTEDWYWNEAPYVLKRRGRYHQLFSGGAFADESYATGVADARSLRGPWRKDARNPVLRSSERIVGPGHVSFVFGPDAATRYAVYHGYVDGDPGRKVLLDRLFWDGEGPGIAGPTDGEQPVPPQPFFDSAIPHWRAEAWVRGSWLTVAGIRLELDPPGVWHQIEVVQLDGRSAVRVGGVLRASRPGDQPAGLLATDGEVACQTLTSCLHDEAVHDLPAGSSYAWRWG
ncbi:MAG: family 43 glycosylhydrolase, partial [Thermoleophilia bacterium]|nr:family 43 glycosylhydrolase [Thermoleophilia bacterium]